MSIKVGDKVIYTGEFLAPVLNGKIGEVVEIEGEICICNFQEVTLQSRVYVRNLRKVVI